MKRYDTVLFERIPLPILVPFKGIKPHIQYCLLNALLDLTVTKEEILVASSRLDILTVKSDLLVSAHF